MDLLYDLNTNLPKTKTFTECSAFLNLVIFLAKLKSLYYLSNIWSRFKIIVAFFFVNSVVALMCMCLSLSKIHIHSSLHILQPGWEGLHTLQSKETKH